MGYSGAGGKTDSWKKQKQNLVTLSLSVCSELYFLFYSLIKNSDIFARNLFFKNLV